MAKNCGTDSQLKPDNEMNVSDKWKVMKVLKEEAEIIKEVEGE